VSATPEPVRSRETIDTVAGLLAAVAMLVSLLAVAYRPVRIAPATIIIALVAVGIGGRHHRLAAIAVVVTGTAWFAGMIIAIVTKHPLF
jgi:hypothetical protein